MINKDLRRDIVTMITKGEEGHIPSSFSIIDIIDHLYGHVLKFDPKRPDWSERDYFILSKGHGAAALYAVLHKYQFLSQEHINKYSQVGGILGGHPDTTCVPGAEASTGSLGHGFPTAAGLALGLKVQDKPNRVFALLGDGECNEGTIWETALVASHRKLGNLVAIVDYNESSDQILPIRPIVDKWQAFGFETYEINGHDLHDLQQVFLKLKYEMDGKPKVIIAHTVKGKGVSFLEGHGKWHHKIPSKDELTQILAELA